MITKEQVLQALGTVQDPDLKRDLVTLNMIEDIQVQNERVSFRLVLTTPACPLKEQIEQDCKKAISKIAQTDIDIQIETTSRVTSTREQEEMLPNVKNVIVVASGKGGVGKSTVSVNLAVSLAKSGAKVGLLDADIYGPSIPIMLGAQDAKPKMINVEGNTKIVPLDIHGVKALSIGFLVKQGQAMVWRGPMASSALKQLVRDAEWGALDYLIIDLPPGTGDMHLTILKVIPKAAALVVTTPQQVSVADTQKAIDMFKNDQINTPILGLVDNMAYFTPPELPDKKYYLFGKGGSEKLAQEHQLEVLIQLPISEDVGQGNDSGKPISMQDNDIGKKFHNLAKKVAQQVAILNARRENIESGVS